MPKKSAHKSRRHTPSPFFMIATAIIGTLLVGAAALRVGLGPAAPGLHLPGGQARTLPGLSTYGISGSFGDLSAADLTKRLADIHATGASWIRYDLNWGHVQLAGPSSFDWSVPDRVTTAAHDQGLEVVMTIDLTPPWQRVPGCNQGERCAPQDPDAYAAFAAAAVTHYLSYGVHVWEIWNEPNIAYRFGPATDPIKYTKMLTKASARIRQVDPTATIIAASTAPASSKHGDLRPLDFLQAMYSNGAQGSFDALSVHPYTYPVTPSQSSPDDAWGQMFSMHQLMAQAGDGAKPIWITEFGAPTGGIKGDPTDPYVSEAVQAQTITEAISLFRAQSWSGPFFWYNWQDAATGNASSENFYGLLRADGSHKPSYDAFVLKAKQ